VTAVVQVTRVGGFCSEKNLNHVGDSNFVVNNYPLSGTYDLLVNEIGNYSGEQILDPDVMQIQADGEWQILPQ